MGAPLPINTMDPTGLMLLYTSITMHGGPGTIPLITTALSYHTMAQALRTAADGSQGQVRNLRLTWEGKGARSAEAAFDEHSNWLRQQAERADRAGRLANRAGEVFAAARAAVPTPDVVADVISTRNTAVLSGPAGAGTAVSAELVLTGMKVHTDMVMSTYTQTTQSILGALPPVSTAAPFITPPGGDVPPGPGGGPPLSDGISFEQPPGSPPGGSGGGPWDSGPGGGPSDSGPGGGPSDSGPGGGGPSGGDTPTDTLPPSDSGLGDPLQPPDPGLSDPTGGLDLPSGGSYGDYPSEFLGTSPNSSTLAALNSGGVLPPVGMVTGAGLGAGGGVGAGSGLRLPSGWNPAGGVPFGAQTGNPAGAAPAPARRGATAPVQQMRRNRKDEEKSKKVFAEPSDGRVLEPAPDLAVIEYHEEEPEVLEADSSLVGILERFDDEPDSRMEEFRGRW